MSFSSIVTGVLLIYTHICFAQNKNHCKTPNKCGSPFAGRCANIYGSYRCICNPGYRLINNTCKMTDTDECNSNPTICGPSSAGRCHNTAGSYRCECLTGYKMTNNGCDDIEECVDPLICGSGPTTRCVNTAGSYTCQTVCATGYAARNNRCEDIDECLITPLVCGSASAGLCVNTEGSYTCLCNPGYQLVNKRCEVTNTPNDISPTSADSSSGGTCPDTAVTNTPNGISPTFADSCSGGTCPDTADVQAIGIAVGVVLGTSVIITICVIVFIRHFKKRGSAGDNREHDDVNAIASPSSHLPGDVTDGTSTDAIYVNVTNNMHTDEDNVGMMYEEISTAYPVVAGPSTQQRISSNTAHSYISVMGEGEITDQPTDGIPAKSSQYEVLSPDNVRNGATYTSLGKKGLNMASGHKQ